MKFNETLEAAEQAFFAEIARAYNLKTGDLSPFDSLPFTISARRAMKAYLDTNLTRQFKIDNQTYDTDGNNNDNRNKHTSTNDYKHDYKHDYKYNGNYGKGQL